MDKILVIDDQADVRLAATVALQQLGLQCLEAEGPEHAFDVLKSEHISLILLDMNYKLDTTSGEEGLRFFKATKYVRFNHSRDRNDGVGKH